MVECSQCNKLNCKACIEDWRKKQENCPNCRADFAPTPKPNLYVVNILKEMPFLCKNCPEQFKFGEHARHVKICAGSLFVCPACDEKDLTRDAIMAHWQNTCIKAKLTCKKCTLIVNRLEAADHDCIRSLLEQHARDQAEIARLTAIDNAFKNELLPKLMKEYEELKEDNSRLRESAKSEEAKQMICCKYGHPLRMRTTPKPRWMIVSGNNVYCDACKCNLDIPGGYYTCD